MSSNIFLTTIFLMQEILKGYVIKCMFEPVVIYCVPSITNKSDHLGESEM